MEQITVSDVSMAGFLLLLVIFFTYHRGENKWEVEARLRELSFVRDLVYRRYIEFEYTGDRYVDHIEESKLRNSILADVNKALVIHAPDYVIKRMMSSKGDRKKRADVMSIFYDKLNEDCNRVNRTRNKTYYIRNEIHVLSTWTIR